LPFGAVAFRGLTPPAGGHPPAQAGDFGAHFLRSGFLTSAARRGAPVFKMRKPAQERDVLQAYVRDADLFRIMRGAIVVIPTWPGAWSVPAQLLIR